LRRQEVKLGVLADATGENGVVGKRLQDRGVGIATIAKDVERVCGTVRLGIESLTEGRDLLGGTAGEARPASGFAVLSPILIRSFGGRSGGRGCVEEGDRHHAVIASGKGDVGGELQKALSADEVGLELGTEGVAAPGDARNADAAFAQECVVDGNAKRGLRGQVREGGTPDFGEECPDGESLLREEPIVGGPIEELLTAGGEQAGHGMTSEAKQAA
jgi:hypothetical protein